MGYSPTGHKESFTTATEHVHTLLQLEFEVKHSFPASELPPVLSNSSQPVSGECGIAGPQDNTHRDRHSLIESTVQKAAQKEKWLCISGHCNETFKGEIYSTLARPNLDQQQLSYKHTENPVHDQREGGEEVSKNISKRFY